MNDCKANKQNLKIKRSRKIKIQTILSSQSWLQKQKKTIISSDQKCPHPRTLPSPHLSPTAPAT